MTNLQPYYNSKPHDWSNVIGVIVVVGIWAFFTILYWVTWLDCTDQWHFNDLGDCTLVDVIKSQWEWIKDLTNRIV